MIKEMGFKKAQKTLRDIYNYHSALRFNNLEKFIKEKTRKELSCLQKRADDNGFDVEALKDDLEIQAAQTANTILAYVKGVSSNPAELENTLLAFENGLNESLVKEWDKKPRFKAAMFSHVRYCIDLLYGMEGINKHPIAKMPKTSNVIDRLDHD